MPLRFQKSRGLTDRMETGWNVNGGTQMERLNILANGYGSGDCQSTALDTERPKSRCQPSDRSL